MRYLRDIVLKKVIDEYPTDIPKTRKLSKGSDFQMDRPAGSGC